MRARDRPRIHSAGSRRCSSSAPATPNIRKAGWPLAEAALAAELWGAARRELDAVLGISPTARACRLRARLEEAEHGDGAAARAWLARAAEAAPDAAWVCDGCGAAWAEWQPVCPRCEAVDELVWRHPERVVSLAPQEHESGAIAPPRPARAALPPRPLGQCRFRLSHPALTRGGGRTYPLARLSRRCSSVGRATHS